MRADLQREAFDLIQITRSVWTARGVTDKNSAFLRKPKCDLLQNGKTAVTRIENAYRSIIVGLICSSTSSQVASLNLVIDLVYVTMIA